MPREEDEKPIIGLDLLGERVTQEAYNVPPCGFLIEPQEDVLFWKS